MHRRAEHRAANAGADRHGPRRLVQLPRRHRPQSENTAAGLDLGRRRIRVPLAGALGVVLLGVTSSTSPWRARTCWGSWPHPSDTSPRTGLGIAGVVPGVASATPIADR